MSQKNTGISSAFQPVSEVQIEIRDPAAPAITLYTSGRASGSTGYGRLEIGLARALRARGVTIDDPDAPLGLVIGNPTLGYTHPASQRLWCYTMSEADRLGHEWRAALNQRFERCLVPTPELVTIYKASGVTIPVEYLPLGVDFADIALYPRNPDAAKDATPEKPFVFLAYAIGDLRKGVDLAMWAFNRLFGGDLRYRMVIKCRDNPRWLAGLDDPQIKIVRGELRERDWQRMMAESHAFIFPSRGEGFGLPPREAVLSGLPTVATRWLGMWDVAQWGYPVEVEGMRPAQFEFWEANAKGSQWSEPRDKDIDTWMQVIIDDYPAALAKARQGQEYLLEHFTWERAAEQLTQQIVQSEAAPRPVEIKSRGTIALTLASLNPGGGETQLCNLAAQLRAHGYDATVVVPGGAGSQSEKLCRLLERNAVPCIVFHPLRDGLEALTEVYRKLKPDLVIACGWPITLDAMLAAYRAGVPRRVIQFVSDGFERGEVKIEWWYEFAGMQAATHLVGNSQAVAASSTPSPALPHCNKEGSQIRVIHNGVDVPHLTAELRAEARRFWGLKDDEVAIGLLANFRGDGLKNQMMLVRAAERVLKACPNAVFILAGYHTDYAINVAKEVEARGLGDRVRLPGLLEDGRMIAGWDVAVNCSTTEGFSNAIQECMTYGLPVVATRVGGTPEMLDELDMVASDDDAAMAEKLIALVNLPRFRASRGAENRLRAQMRWGWLGVLRQWLELMPETARA